MNASVGVASVYPFFLLLVPGGSHCTLRYKRRTIKVDERLDPSEPTRQQPPKPYFTDAHNRHPVGKAPAQTKTRTAK